MSTLLPFAFGESMIRVIPDESGEPLFVGKDVAKALGYPESSLKQLNNLFYAIPDEWKGHNQIMTLGGTQDMLTLTEQGLYFFLGRSDKPKALPFQKWLAGEVLPSLRRTGSYALATAKEPLAPEGDVPSILSRLGLPDDVFKLNAGLRVRLLGIAARIALMDAEQQKRAFATFGKLCEITTAEEDSEPEGSPVKLFVRERLVRSGDRTQARVLYEAFVDWCYSRDIMPCSIRRFCGVLRRRFHSHLSNRTYFYCALVVDAQSREVSA